MDGSSAPLPGRQFQPPPPPPSQEKYQRSTRNKNILDMTHDEYVESWNSMKLAVVATADGQGDAQVGAQAGAGAVGR